MHYPSPCRSEQHENDPVLHGISSYYGEQSVSNMADLGSFYVLGFMRLQVEAPN